MERREAGAFEPFHIINVNIKDNHEEATRGAIDIQEMCDALEKLPKYGLDDGIDEVLETFEKQTRRPTLHYVHFR